jgi:hypothetical protein
VKSLAASWKLIVLLPIKLDKIALAPGAMVIVFSPDDPNTRTYDWYGRVKSAELFVRVMDV